MTQAFIRTLEFLAPSINAIENMRSHPVFLEFERRWQLPVYFQLRWKEIAGRVEEALQATKIEQLPSQSRDRVFLTTQAETVWNNIVACWSAEVFMSELAHRFWRLTLQVKEYYSTVSFRLLISLPQLISRYRTWLNSSLAVSGSIAASSAVEKVVDFGVIVSVILTVSLYRLPLLDQEHRE
jgi:conserved oligomeric Golgi complex subunit 2